MQRAATVEHHEAVSQLMVETRAFLNGLDLIPRVLAGRRGSYVASVDAILLGLLSKSIVLTEAIALLVCHRHQDEAFGLCRTCIEIRLTIRYLTNADTVSRCDRYVGYFAKDTMEWGKLYRRYNPNHTLEQRSDAAEIEKSAAAYRSPHKWAEEDTIKEFASEADSFERAADGSPLNETFSYEILYKWMSHYVHATVRSIDPAHVTEPGDRFRVHSGGDGQSPRDMGNLALMSSLQAVQMNLASVLRSFNMTLPDYLQSQYAAVLTLRQSPPV